MKITFLEKKAYQVVDKPSNLAVSYPVANTSSLNQFNEKVRVRKFTLGLLNNSSDVTLACEYIPDSRGNTAGRR